jgi:hypothetical protein
VPYRPRQIEFLYSRNRLNVAISHARCLRNTPYSSENLLQRLVAEYPEVLAGELIDPTGRAAGYW